VVVKAQIHAGGRGKGRFLEHPDLGGVNVVVAGPRGGVAAAEAEVGALAEAMLGSTLVTLQTGPDGKRVKRLYVEQGIDIARELYLSVVLDRSTGRNLVMGSVEGGTEIEEVAARRPDAIVRRSSTRRSACCRSRRTRSPTASACATRPPRAGGTSSWRSPPRPSSSTPTWSRSTPWW
jgi:succinyl-CoA synthetase beta subunit